jgi:hypothetical protein
MPSGPQPKIFTPARLPHLAGVALAAMAFLLPATDVDRSAPDVLPPVFRMKTSWGKFCNRQGCWICAPIIIFTIDAMTPRDEKVCRRVG